MGRLRVTGQLPLSPRCFGCWRSLRSCGRRRPVYPQGKDRGICGGNQRRRSAGADSAARRPPTKEGLDGPERTRTIRQDSSQNVVDTPGPGRDGALRQHGMAPTAGRASGRPFLGELCEPSTSTSVLPGWCSGWRDAPPRGSHPLSRAVGGPPPATNRQGRPRAADRQR